MEIIVLLNMLIEKKMFCPLNVTVLYILISCQSPNISVCSHCIFFIVYLSSFCSSSRIFYAHPTASWVLVYPHCWLHQHSVMNHWMKSQFFLSVTSVFIAWSFWCLRSNFYTNSARVKVAEMGFQLKGNEITTTLFWYCCDKCDNALCIL